MKTKTRSTHQIVEEQVKRWEVMKHEKKQEAAHLPVITISREPGSGGKVIAEKLAEKLGADLFHQHIINKMSESSQASRLIIETLDERGLTILEDWISSMIYDRHLWPDEYLKHLLKIIGTIGRHGRAVIVGRGANFILPREKCFRVRIIAPLHIRVQNVAKEYGASEKESMRRISRSESERSAFVRKHFHSDITNPLNYDLVINTGSISIERSVDAVINALNG